ncbi:Do family serine endopeptidase [Jiella mangrovi]|uniref:Probable periplasmic serine endoprotease DegP-like n=1 Tax=Jiella mangrovi TaxID=2821407 RepID=A0ABS4BH35_9HYPH|nr:Do family serine endopeptidase [Jiella mangrovi]MBP0616062.1 Do family serine endopeptidase [Jiella mangrovi]
MTHRSIFRNHRAAACLGAAIIAVPLAAYPVLASSAGETASSGSQTPVDAKVTTDMHADSYAPIVSADKPAVVTIISHMDKDSSPAAEREGGRRDPRQMPFDEFMRRFFGDNGQGMPFGPGQSPFQEAPHHEMTALGSGFIINKNGTIVTNNHVVDGGTDLKVILDDGTELPGKVIGRDPKSDLAVVKVDAGHDLPVISWGNSDDLKLGDHVLAIGNPFGIGTTVTSGIVSARGRDLNGGPYDDFIQVDAAINTGNSGGPLVAMNGQVVGIDSAIYSPNGGNVGVGFAIPSDEAKGIVQKLIEHGSIQHGFLGVEIQPVTDDIKNALGLDNKQGALVASVSDGSPASEAGIKPGDIIESIDGKSVADARALSRDVADLTPDTKTEVKVLRQGDEKTLPITIGNMKDADEVASNDAGDSGQSGYSGGRSVLGMHLGALDDQTRSEFGLSDDDSGVVVEKVDQDSAAADDDIEPGDLIVSVNQVPVKHASDVEKAVRKARDDGRKQVLLLVERGDQTQFVALPTKNG